MSLDRFYPIFDDVSWLDRMLPLGVKLVQLRIKDKPDEVVLEQISRAKQVCAHHDCTLVVNDYWQHAIDAGCEWLHLGQEDLDDADLGAIKKADIHLGISTHDDDELERALALDPGYVALGPVYPTILKMMKWHQQGLPKVREWKKRIGSVPLVGIGGMRVERAKDVFEAGADIVSVVTDITLNQSPEMRLEQWLSVTR